MLIGYARVSKSDGSQTVDLQVDALAKYGVELDNIYSECISGVKPKRPEFEQCIRSLRKGDTLVVWKLDRLGRSLKDLVTIVSGLSDSEINFKVLAGQGADIDTSTAAGRMIFGIFATLAEYERELIRERVNAGLAAARARGRKGGRRPVMTKAKIRLAEVAMKSRETSVPELCRELGVSVMTLYRYISPEGSLRAPALKILN